MGKRGCSRHDNEEERVHRTDSPRAVAFLLHSLRDSTQEGKPWREQVIPLGGAGLGPVGSKLWSSYGPMGSRYSTQVRSNYGPMGSNHSPKGSNFGPVGLLSVQGGLVTVQRGLITGDYFGV